MYPQHTNRLRQHLTSERMINNLSQMKSLTRDEKILRIESNIQSEKLEELNAMESELVDLNAAFGELNQLIALQSDEIDTTLDSSDRVLEKVDRGSGRLRYAREKSDAHRRNLVFVLLCLFVILAVVGALVFIVLR